MSLPRQDWPETLATVRSCTYDLRAGRALAFGLPSGKHFRIQYDYWAAGAVHTGEYFSAIAVEQGSLVPLRYDPDLPRRNDRGPAQMSARRALLLLGAAGSVLLSLAWFTLLRGCV